MPLPVGLAVPLNSKVHYKKQLHTVLGFLCAPTPDGYRYHLIGANGQFSYNVHPKEMELIGGKPFEGDQTSPRGARRLE